MKYNKMAIKFNELIQKHIQEEDFQVKTPVQFVQACALFYYNENSNYTAITKSLKYKSNIIAGKFFAKMLAQKIQTSDLFKNVDIIIPVPLHKSRKRQRGYNQAKIIADTIAQNIGATVCDNILVRKKKTLTQTKLNIEEKYENVKGAFSVNSEKLWKILGNQTHHIVIIDDVFTTGSTIFECYKVIFEEIYKKNDLFLKIFVSLFTLGYVGN